MVIPFIFWATSGQRSSQLLHFPHMKELKNDLNIREFFKTGNIVWNVTGNGSTGKSGYWSKYAVVMCEKFTLLPSHHTVNIVWQKCFLKHCSWHTVFVSLDVEYHNFLEECSYARKRSFSYFHEPFIIHISRIF